MFQKLSDALALYAEKFSAICAVVFTVWIPGGLALHALEVYGAGLGVLQYIVELLLGLSLHALSSAGVLHVLARSTPAEPTTHEGAIGGAFAAFPRLIGAYLLVAPMVLVGFVALIVPGLLLCARWYFMDAVVVFEGARPLEAMGTSARLSQGRRWRLFWIAAGSIAVWLVVSLLTGSLTASLSGRLGGVFVPIAPAVAVCMACVENAAEAYLSAVAFVYYLEARRESPHPTPEGPATIFRQA